MSRWHSPMLVVDFNYNIIRIHRSTLDALGNPEYVEILVSPKHAKIGIRAHDKQTITSQKVNSESLLHQRSIQLYSTDLARELLEINPKWENDQIYRMEGVLIDSENMVLFNGMDSELIHSEEYATAQ